MWPKKRKPIAYSPEDSDSSVTSLDYSVSTSRVSRPVTQESWENFPQKFSSYSFQYYDSDSDTDSSDTEYVGPTHMKKKASKKSVMSKKSKARSGSKTGADKTKKSLSRVSGGKSIKQKSKNDEQQSYYASSRRSERLGGPQQIATQLLAAAEKDYRQEQDKSVHADDTIQNGALIEQDDIGIDENKTSIPSDMSHEAEKREEIVDKTGIPTEKTRGKSLDELKESTNIQRSRDSQLKSSEDQQDFPSASRSNFGIQENWDWEWLLEEFESLQTAPENGSIPPKLPDNAGRSSQVITNTDLAASSDAGPLHKQREEDSRRPSELARKQSRDREHSRTSLPEGQREKGSRPLSELLRKQSSDRKHSRISRDHSKTSFPERQRRKDNGRPPELSRKHSRDREYPGASREHSKTSFLERQRRKDTGRPPELSRKHSRDREYPGASREHSKTSFLERQRRKDTGRPPELSRKHSRDREYPGASREHSRTSPPERQREKYSRRLLEPSQKHSRDREHSRTSREHLKTSSPKRHSERDSIRPSEMSLKYSRDREHSRTLRKDSRTSSPQRQREKRARRSSELSRKYTKGREHSRTSSPQRERGSVRSPEFSRKYSRDREHSRTLSRQRQREKDSRRSSELSQNHSIDEEYANPPHRGIEKATRRSSEQSPKHGRDAQYPGISSSYWRSSGETKMYSRPPVEISRKHSLDKEYVKSTHTEREKCARRSLEQSSKYCRDTQYPGVSSWRRLCEIDMDSRPPIEISRKHSLDREYEGIYGPHIRSSGDREKDSMPVGLSRKRSTDQDNVETYISSPRGSSVDREMYPRKRPPGQEENQEYMRTSDSWPLKKSSDQKNMASKQHRPCDNKIDEKRRSSSRKRKESTELLSPPSYKRSKRRVDDNGRAPHGRGSYEKYGDKRETYVQSPPAVPKIICEPDRNGSPCKDNTASKVSKSVNTEGFLPLRMIPSADDASGDIVLPTRGSSSASARKGKGASVDETALAAKLNRIQQQSKSSTGQRNSTQSVCDDDSAGFVTAIESLHKNDTGISSQKVSPEKSHLSPKSPCSRDPHVMSERSAHHMEEVIKNAIIKACKAMSGETKEIFAETPSAKATAVQSPERSKGSQPLPWWCQDPKVIYKERKVKEVFTIRRSSDRFTVLDMEDREPPHQPETPRRVYENNNNPDDGQPKGVVVYQMITRYATFGGLRVAGGVRILLDVNARQGYVQIISLLSEVFVTHYVSTLTFLNSTSAAGVAWCAVVCEPPKQGERPSGSTSPRVGENYQENKSMPQNDPKDQPPQTDVSRGKVDTAHVVFFDPYQAHRFRTVLETIKCAFSDDGCVALPCVQPPPACPRLPCVPLTIVDPCQPKFPPCHPCPVQCHCPCPQIDPCTGQPTISPISNPPATPCGPPPSVFSNHCSSVPMPTNEPPGGLYPPEQPCISGLSNRGVMSPNAPPNSSVRSPYEPSPVSNNPIGTVDLVKDPLNLTGSNNTGLCGDLTANTAGNYAQSTSLHPPYDPYSYENSQGKILFCSTACLVHLGKDQVWLDMQKGILKIIQCPNSMGYSIVLENIEKASSLFQFITKETIFEPAPKTQYGFIYKVATSGERCHNEEHYLLSFKCESNAEKFKAIVDYIHCLLMIAPDDNCNNAQEYPTKNCISRDTKDNSCKPSALRSSQKRAWVS